jgi:hypothetical protein
MVGWCPLHNLGAHHQPRNGWTGEYMIELILVVRRLLAVPELIEAIDRAIRGDGFEVFGAPPARVSGSNTTLAERAPGQRCRRLSHLGAHFWLATRLDPSDASLRRGAGGTGRTSRSGWSPQTGRSGRTCRTGHHGSSRRSRRPLFALHPGRAPRTRLPRVRTHSCPDEPARKSDEQGTHPGPHAGQDDHSDPTSGPVFLMPLRLHPASVSRVRDSKQQGPCSACPERGRTARRRPDAG